MRPRRSVAHATEARSLTFKDLPSALKVPSNLASRRVWNICFAYCTISMALYFSNPVTSLQEAGRGRTELNRVDSCEARPMMLGYYDSIEINLQLGDVF